MRLSSNSKLPSFLYVGLVWAEANTREAGGADKRADSLKVATWLSVAIKRRIQACATEGIIVVPGWEPVSSWQETRVIPTLASTDFTCCFPSASNELPLRATFLKAMEEKLSIPEVQEEWQNVIKAHNAKFNKAGVPYSGEGSGPNAAGTEGSEGNTRQKRKLDVVEEPPQGNKFLKLEHHGKGNAIFDVDGNVWFQAKDNADAALDHDGPPIALIYGNFKIQQEAEKLLETQKDDVMMIGFEDDESKGVFRMQQEPQGTLCSLRDFLLKLEKDGSDVTTLDLACHKIEPQVNKDEAGDVQSRTFKVTKTGPCVFVPAETPRKIASAKPPTWEDAGSLVCASTSKTRSTFGPGYTNKTCVLQVTPRWLVSNNAQSFSLTPEKPGLFVSEDSVVPAGKVTKLV
ncbi:unnamed protein product [Cladocopium goreaui]|uniref:Uncharacterized protein n=1 Tax=Cladocopium goreaui TaxID=2562237 RepID=A0A9P1BMD6_9DINO|nr:unnamed protein product [Cladocopium goreaui]